MGVCKAIASSLGVSFAGQDSDAKDLIDAVAACVSKNAKFKEELDDQARRIATLQLQLSGTNMEGIELRRALHSAWQSSEPAVIQLKQLLLDPAVLKEFQHLRSEYEKSQAELKKAQQELEAVTFTQDSKAGRMLMAKCKTLQEENEEMGRELSEGRIHHLETQLALAKNFADEMRRKYLELEEHCCALDEEAEDLQQAAFMLKGNPPPPPPPAPLPASGGGHPDYREGGGRGSYDRKPRGRSRERKRGPPPEGRPPPPERGTPAERGPPVDRPPLLPERGPPERGPYPRGSDMYSRRRFK
eukprot:evm.model.scf_1727.4 EVM.evm.TU.scf_1727.4   scf_1727:21339-24332(+)